ncbi:MAG TPA: response regulator, partial [Spirochaetia bacterium]|nr:response regulator [Spirochaetia bacterium]
RITIEDQGTGIAPTVLPHIFDPYFTTKAKGTGLGLSTVFSIVRRHDGHTGVQSSVGVGTCFTIHLPARPDVHGSGPSGFEPAPRGQGRLLIMDDEPSVRALLERILTHLGYEVCSTADGAEAVERYREARQAGKGYAAVILDLTIPGGMGGAEAIRLLREYDPEVKAVVSSGYSTGAVMAEYRSWGFQGMIAKPYTVQQLARLLQQVLAEP